jgi:hypothetical protein
VAKIRCDFKPGLFGILAMPQSPQSYSTAPNQPATSAPKPGEPRFLEQVANACRVKHLAYRTEQSYVAWVKRFILFHNKQHPKDMGTVEIRAFLTPGAMPTALRGHANAQRDRKAHAHPERWAPWTKALPHPVLSLRPLCPLCATLCSSLRTSPVRALARDAYRSSRAARKRIPDCQSSIRDSEAHSKTFCCATDHPDGGIVCANFW